MGASKPTTHKVKKGDTLIGIAKKYGHRDWKAIWDAPENKAVVKKRKDPKKIDTGDVLHIPLNAKQQKENDAELLKLNDARNAEAQALKVLDNEVTRLEARVKLYDSLIKGEVEFTKSLVAQLKANLAGMKKWADGVDAVAMLTQMGVNLGSVAKSGAAATKASGEALTKLNQKALKDASGVVTGPIAPLLAKATQQWKTDDNAALATIGILLDSWNKMTSPSFWAHTYVQMTENGKSWSEAVTMDIGDDIKQRIKEVVARSADNIKKFQAHKKAAEASLTVTQGMIKGSSARIKAYEKSAAAF